MNDQQLEKKVGRDVGKVKEGSRHSGRRYSRPG